MIKFQGNPVNLEGTEVRLGKTFRDFIVSKNDLSSLTLKDTSGVRVFLTIPSLDTSVCDMEVRHFNEKINNLKNVTCYTISMDLPFVQSRWCGIAGIEKVIIASDYKDRSFGKSTGTYITELGLLTRAAFVVDSNEKVVYVKYIEEIISEPNYEKINNFLVSILSFNLGINKTLTIIAQIKNVIASISSAPPIPNIKIITGDVATPINSKNLSDEDDNAIPLSSFFFGSMIGKIDVDASALNDSKDEFKKVIKSRFHN